MLLRKHRLNTVAFARPCNVFVVLRRVRNSLTIIIIIIIIWGHLALAYVVLHTDMDRLQ